MWPFTTDRLSISLPSNKTGARTYYVRTYHTPRKAWDTTFIFRRVPPGMEFPICLSDAVYLRVKIKVENRHAQDSRYTVFQESVYTYVLLRMLIIPLATSTSPDRIISCPVIWRCCCPACSFCACIAHNRLDYMPTTRNRLK